MLAALDFPGIPAFTDWTVEPSAVAALRTRPQLAVEVALLLPPIFNHAASVLGAAMPRDPAA